MKWNISGVSAASSAHSFFEIIDDYTFYWLFKAAAGGNGCVAFFFGFWGDKQTTA